MAFNPYLYQMPTQYPQYAPAVNPQTVVNPQPATPQQTPTQQNGGFMAVRTENDVINYPIAPGNFMTFKIEGQPIVMEKSMGFSQFEAPHIKRFRLVEEEIAAKEEVPDNTLNYALKSDIEEIHARIDEVSARFDGIEKSLKAKRKPKEEDDGV